MPVYRRPARVPIRTFGGPAGRVARAQATVAAITARRDAAMSARRAYLMPEGLAGRFRRAGFYQRFGQQAVAAGLTPEKKFFDTTLSFLIDATGEVPASGQLALIAQGDTESTRDGRDVVIKSIQIRGHMNLAPAAAATCAGNTHMYLVLDTQCNGAAATAAGDGGVFTADTFSVAMLNLNNSGRFRILKHWIHEWNPAGGATTAYNNVNQTFEFYKACEIKMTFSGATGAITEIRSNNLFLLAGASSGIDDLVTVAGTCRLRFMG